MTTFYVFPARDAGRVERPLRRRVVFGIDDFLAVSACRSAGACSVLSILGRIDDAAAVFGVSGRVGHP